MYSEEKVIINESISDIITIGEQETVVVSEDNLEVLSVAIGPNDYISTSVINAKGDIIVGDINAKPIRLPIGSPDYFAVVDPTQDRGYKFTNTIDGGTF